MKFFFLWSRIVFASTILFVSSGASYGQSQLDRKSVVFIQVKCLNKITGVETKEQGSGFVITKDGFILTALHVVACNGINGETLERVSISGKIGSLYESERKLELIKLDAQSDVALLEFRGLPQEYSHLKICRLQKPISGSSFIAAGFPEGNDFQPVSGIVGNTDAGGGLWSVSSPFHTGMSGGPVMQNGYVVGIVKGGYGNITSLRKIIPTYLAKSVIEVAISDFFNCPSVEIKIYKNPSNFKAHWKMIYDSKGKLEYKKVRIKNNGPNIIKVVAKGAGVCTMTQVSSDCASKWTNWCDGLLIQPGQDQIIEGREIMVGLEGFVLSFCRKNWSDTVSTGEATITHDCKGKYCNN